MQITATTRGAKMVRESVRRALKEENKAMETAVRVEGFRLRKQLMSDLRTNAFHHEPLSHISFYGRTAARRNNPLLPLAKHVRYHVTRDPFSVAVGWTGPRLSHSWKRIALRLQEGARRPVEAWKRRSLARIGGKMGRRAVRRKYHFLRSDTKYFDTPARPVIGPFWAANEHDAWQNIRRNYRKKLKGKRI